jgi:outer membrane protein assembly factor BamB
MRVLVLVTSLAVVASAHPWACFHGDPQHTGRSPYVVGAPLSRVAAYCTGGEVSGSPVVRDDGAVLVGARDVKLYCLDGNLTSPQWVADLAGYGTSIYFSAPALDDSGNAYITTSRKLVKVSRVGTVEWAWPDHNSLSISHSPVIGQDGKVYFACYSDSLYALNPDSTLAWAADLGNSVNSAPAVGPDGRIYIATTRGSGCKLWCFEPDGSSPWSFDLAAGAELASPAVGPDTVIYIGAGRYLYAVNPNGTLKWRDSLLAQVQSCPAIANESTLYVVAGARLYCIDADSGVRWRVSIGGSNYCSPAVDAQGNVFVGSANGPASALYCIAPDSTIVDSYVIGDDIWSSPAIGGTTTGRVYFGGMNDSIYLFMGPGAALADAGGTPPVRGQRLWPNPTSGVVNLPRGTVAPRVFNAFGRLVSATRGRSAIDLYSLSAGVYHIEVNRSGRTSIEKVVLR